MELEDEELEELQVGAIGGIVAFNDDELPTPAGPYVGALVGAFKVVPTEPGVGGANALTEDVKGEVDVAEEESDAVPGGPTNVISRPIVLAPFPVNILLPFGCVVLIRLYATTSPFVEDVTLVICAKGNVY